MSTSRPGWARTETASHLGCLMLIAVLVILGAVAVWAVTHPIVLLIPVGVLALVGVAYVIGQRTPRG